MTTLQTLEAQAATNKAINCAKHKAAGKNFRIEIQAFGPRGAYLSTKVFYTVDNADSTIMQCAIKAGSKSLSQSFETAIIKAL